MLKKLFLWLMLKTVVFSFFGNRFISGLFIYLFRGMNVQELNHLYVDFPQIYGFVNYNHHECKRADPPGDIWFSISLPVLFEEVGSMLVSDQASFGVYLGWACVSRWPREQQVVWEPETQHCPSLAKLLSYIPSVKQTHFIENLWSSYISVIRNLVCHKGQIHPRGKSFSNVAYSAEYVLIFMNGCYWFCCFAYGLIDLHIQHYMTWVTIHPLAKTVHPGLIYWPEAFTMFIAWVSIPHIWSLDAFNFNAYI